MKLIALFVLSGLVLANSKQPVGNAQISADQLILSGGVSKKQVKELEKFTVRGALLDDLIGLEETPHRLKKGTLYFMKNFQLIQKIKGGYLITGDAGPSPVKPAFLKTPKQLPQGTRISGAVVYSGDFRYPGMDGFTKSVPMLTIPAALPISGITESNPFENRYY